VRLRHFIPAIIRRHIVPHHFRHQRAASRMGENDLPFIRNRDRIGCIGKSL